MPSIEARGLDEAVRRDVLAVDHLDFDARPGGVTGFLGPNGAGKTTTLRMLLGLVTPTSGSVLIDGHRYRDLANPTMRVGAVLEASGFHPARTARNHLKLIATTARIPFRRVDECLDLVGLADAGRQGCRRVLDGYAPATRAGARIARQPRHPRSRRAGERTRPSGHRVAPRFPQVVRVRQCRRG